MFAPLLLSAVCLASVSSTAVVEVGASGIGYQSVGARFGDASFVTHAYAQTRWGGFTLDGSALVSAPVTREGAGTDVTLVPRAGWSWRRLSLRAGPWVNLAPSARPVSQVLVSVRTQLDFDRFGVSLGIFDVAGQVPLHLSLELERFSVGYVAPLGALARLRWPVWGPFSLSATGYVYRLFNTDTAMLSVGLGFRQGR